MGPHRKLSAERMWGLWLSGGSGGSQRLGQSWDLVRGVEPGLDCEIRFLEGACGTTGMSPAGLLGVSQWEAAAGHENHSEGEAGEREELGLVLHLSEAGAVEEVREPGQDVLGVKAVPGADTDGGCTAPRNPGSQDLTTRKPWRSPKPAGLPASLQAPHLDCWGWT